jgi:hypothetical protein
MAQLRRGGWRMRPKNTTPCKHGVITGKGRRCNKCALLHEKPETRAKRLARSRARMNYWKKENPKRAKELNRLSAARVRALDPEKVLRARRLADGLPSPTRPAPTLCECCGGPPRGGPHNRLVLDHCHITGIFRGWLCDLCNRGIGMLGDLPVGAHAAVNYLERAYATAK